MTKGCEGFYTFSPQKIGSLAGRKVMDVIPICLELDSYFWRQLFALLSWERGGKIQRATNFNRHKLGIYFGHYTFFYANKLYIFTWSKARQVNHTEFGCYS